MFKKTNDDNTILCTSDVTISGYETVKANTTIPRGHRLWAVYQAWLKAGNTPEPYQTTGEKQAALEASVRAQRDTLIREADYLVNTALDVGADPTPYRTYRQALRNVPQQQGFPDTITWPTKPAAPTEPAPK